MQPAVRPAILLVDDDLPLLSLLARRLAREGFIPMTAPSGPAALGLLERRWPSLVVVDLMMPNMDGVELGHRIKRIADIPIIVLSAVEADASKVDALQSFAEDYLTKPFSFDELVARINRVLRRIGNVRSSVSVGGGELEIDLAQRQARTAAGVHQLTPIEARVLAVLIGSLDRTVPTETLLDRVWTDSDGADPSYVWVTMRRLRRKLELDPDQPRFLVTERGVGYRLASFVDAGEPVAG
jgi:DNA-binding response OmpR family regulator